MQTYIVQTTNRLCKCTHELTTLLPMQRPPEFPGWSLDLAASASCICQHAFAKHCHVYQRFLLEENVDGFAQHAWICIIKYKCLHSTIQIHSGHPTRASHKKKRHHSCPQKKISRAHKYVFFHDWRDLQLYRGMWQAPDLGLMACNGNNAPFGTTHT